MSRPSTPPPELRPTVSAAERAAIERVVGPVPDDVLLRAVRDARGRTFQRLEFLGDSVLDLVLGVHAVVEPDCEACVVSGRRADPAHLVTDRRLAQRARAAGVGDWLEWEASDDRLADLVEAVAAVAWHSGGWPRVVPLVDALVHPLAPEVGRVVVQGGGSAAGGGPAERRLGSAVLELAAAQQVFDSLPGADEGELSQRRAEVHRTRRVAEFAARTGVIDPAGDDDAVSDRVERWLAQTLVRQGVDAALDRARDALG